MKLTKSEIYGIIREELAPIIKEERSTRHDEDEIHDPDAKEEPEEEEKEEELEEMAGRESPGRYAIRDWMQDHKGQIDQLAAAAYSRGNAARAAEGLYNLLMSIQDADLVGRGVSPDKMGRLLMAVQKLNQIRNPRMRAQRLAGLAYGNILGAEGLQALREGVEKAKPVSLNATDLRRIITQESQKINEIFTSAGGIGFVDLPTMTRRSSFLDENPPMDHAEEIEEQSGPMGGARETIQFDQILEDPLMGWVVEVLRARCLCKETMDDGREIDLDPRGLDPDTEARLTRFIHHSGGR